LANRAKGELGLIAFLLGDVGASVVGLGQAVKVAQTNGDVSSLVRWLTLFGHGYVQLGRPQEALDFYDRALKAAAAVAELQFPVMTHVGKSNALIKLGRIDEADAIVSQAVGKTAEAGSRGYQAQLLMQRGMIANQRKQPDVALALLKQATELAKEAGGHRIVAEVALEAARIQRQRGSMPAAERSLQDGIQASRAMEERLLLPKLLGEQADLRSHQRRYGDAAALLDEAADLLDGLFTSASSPWVQSRLVSGMDEVFLARIHLEGARGQSPARMYAAIEHARGRSLLQLLVNRPLGSQPQSRELLEGQRKIAALQRRLLQTTARDARRRLLDQIFAAEEQLAPASTVFFDRARREGRRDTASLSKLQSALMPDELYIEYALTAPRSYAVVVAKTAARVQQLPSAPAIAGMVATLQEAVKQGRDAHPESSALAAALLGSLPELKSYPRLIVSADGVLHQLPFELLASAEGKLLDSHIVSYAPSGSVLELLRRPPKGDTRSRVVLAMSASPPGAADVVNSAKAVQRGVYDLDATKLKPLPSADDEARSVGEILGPSGVTVLVGDAASEAELKKLPLAEYRVLHFAVHGVPSSKFPASAALLVRAGGTEDGILQAREILTLRIAADLVTLSACETAAGSVHGQEGAATLVRPFMAAGARTVVANLWAADDTFSLALMRQFYRNLAAGADVASALRDAKLNLLKSFGPEATPLLWGGVLVYGDGRGIIAVKSRATAARVH
jgi:CHAT domain-containing protein